MNKVVRLVVVLAACCWPELVRAQLQRAGPCPNVTAVPDLALSKFMGTWFEQIHTKRWSDAELDCSCHHFEMSSPNNFSYDTYSRNPSLDIVYKKRGFVQLKPQAGGKNFALDVSEGGEKNVAFVLDTDYTSYATLWTCLPTNASHYENVVVLTRDRFPGLSALLSALDALDANGIPRMYLVYTEQRNCPDFNITQGKTSQSSTALPAPSQATSAVPSSTKAAPTASSVTANTWGPTMASPSMATSAIAPPSVTAASTPPSMSSMTSVIKNNAPKSEILATSPPSMTTNNNAQMSWTSAASPPSMTIDSSAQTYTSWTLGANSMSTTMQPAVPTGIAITTSNIASATVASSASTPSPNMSPAPSSAAPIDPNVSPSSGAPAATTVATRPSAASAFKSSALATILPPLLLWLVAFLI